MTKWGIAGYFIFFISNNYEKWIVYRAPEKHIFVRSHSNRHRLQLHYCILLPPPGGGPPNQSVLAPPNQSVLGAPHQGVPVAPKPECA